jgi:MFS family permease
MSRHRSNGATRPTTTNPAQDFWLYLLGQTISTFGSVMTSVACSIVAVTVLHVGPAQVAAIVVGGNLPAVVGPLIGTLMDRVLHPRRVLIAGDLLATIAILVCGMAALLHVLTVGILFTVCFLLGAIAVTVQAVYFTHLKSLNVTDLPGARGRMQAGAFLAGLVGALAGAPLAATVSVPLLFFVDAVTYVISAGLLLRIRASDLRAEYAPTSSSFRQEFTAGLRVLQRSSMLVAYLACAAGLTLAMSAIGAQRALYLLTVLHIPVFYFGVPSVAAAILGLAGSLYASKALRRITAWPLIVVTFVVGAAAALALPAAGGPLPLVLFAVTVATALPALTGAMGNLALVTVLCDEIGEEYFGRITTLLTFVTVIAGTAGTALGGLAGEEYGIRQTIWAFTAVIVLATVALIATFLRATPAHDRRAATESR